MGGFRRPRRADHLTGCGVSAVYASTARRAVETAESLADVLRVPVHRTSRLLEYDIGELEGQPIPAGDDQCLAVLRQWVLEERLDARLPGGDSGLEVRQRFEAAVTDIAAAHEGGAAAIVGHVGTMTVGLLGLCRNLTANDVWGHPLPHARPLTVTCDDGTWRCSPWPQRRPVTGPAGR
ncbi:histidine phosphatase family protein [Thermopolyspora sp. NPDC052614]|uniref:histidine phosphatase family protein n=1 Tax=Thermopolyspora sp. NPDC052614 TaxID=3155682 RepID=UPI00341EEB62